MIDSIAPLEILAALPPPTVPGVQFQPRGGNLSFYRSQSEWLDHSGIIVLDYAEYEFSLRKVVDRFGGDGTSVEIAKINAVSGPLPKLITDDFYVLRAYYHRDLPF